MDSTKLGSLNEDDMFEADYREAVLPSRKSVVLKGEQIKNGKQRLNNQSRHIYRASRGKRFNRPNGQC